jgi:hypothetical protein
MEFNTVYSLGSRCQNSEVLRYFGYREFSGFFDFMYVKKIWMTNHILSDNFIEILKDENIVTYDFNKITISPDTGEVLQKSVRTCNKFYDGTLNIDESIFPHHDLKSSKDRQHFLKCVKRFESLKNYNVLFNYSFNTWENNITKDDVNSMVNILKDNYEFSNFKICFISIKQTDNSSFTLIEKSEYYDIWELNIGHNSFTGGLFANTIDNENYISIIKSYNISNSRITKEEIDKHGK